MANETQLIAPSNLEDIDSAIFKYIEDLKLNVTTNKGFKEVPVIWVAGERAYQVKHDKDLRDSAGIVKLPVMTIERASVEKSLTDKGAVYANLPSFPDERGGSQYTISRRIKQDKTSNFANADAKKTYGQVNFKTEKKNEKIVYQTVTIPTPLYVTITYKLNIKTEYQEQMNQLVSPFMSNFGSINYFTLEHNGHTYEAFVQDSYNLNNNVQEMGEETRLYQTDIEIKVLGYVFGSGDNQEQPRVVYRENAVEVKLPREYLIVDGVQPPMYTGGSVTGSAAPTGPLPPSYNNSVDFDGIDDVADHVSTGGVLVTSTTNWSVEMWIKFNSAQTTGEGFFGMGNTASRVNKVVFYTAVSGGKYRVQAQGNWGAGFKSVTGFFTLDPDVWNHVAVVCRGGVDYYLYYNGAVSNYAGNVGSSFTFSPDHICLGGGSRFLTKTNCRIARCGIWWSDRTNEIVASAADSQADWSTADHLYKCGDGDDVYPNLLDAGSTGGIDLVMTNMDASDIVEDYPS